MLKYIKSECVIWHASNVKMFYITVFTISPFWSNLTKFTWNYKYRDNDFDRYPALFQINRFRFLNQCMFNRINFKLQKW